SQELMDMTLAALERVEELKKNADTMGQRLQTIELCHEDRMREFTKMREAQNTAMQTVLQLRNEQTKISQKAAQMEKRLEARTSIINRHRGVKYGERESGVTTRSRTRTKYVKVSEARRRDDELEDEWVEEPEDSHDPEGEDKQKGGDVPPPKQCPLIIKGGHTAYIPWTFMDMIGLIGRLPIIYDGTQIWITRFEEQTTGQHLALGDIKAILSQTLGKAKMTEILDQADLKKTADDPHYDHHPLGPWRTAIWDAMRKTYPTKTDPGKVEKVKLGDDEGMAQFILKLQTIWREEMDAPWDETAASQALFKVMLKRALPSEVQEQLETVVGLNAMPWDTFEANIIHYVELHRKKERETRKATENLL
ncbi:hypothetical protein, partial [Cetobacterium sp.]|uniref:hypothetical protein n=1 Tax=Cetobacterium sp. TaxID=2071632 RepID=UPI003F661C87